MAINPEITLDRVQARLKTIKAKYAVPPEEVTYEYLKSLYLLHRRFGEPERGIQFAIILRLNIASCIVTLRRVFSV